MDRLVSAARDHSRACVAPLYNASHPSVIRRVFIYGMLVGIIRAVLMTLY